MSNKERIAEEIAILRRNGGRRLVAGKDYSIFIDEKSARKKLQKSLDWMIALSKTKSYEEAKQHNLI